ncbi:hypothetical protein GALMADRAFT_232746 [Galerina marginata CBS 339.88]|uniref:Uncharacterized protein n=1 Tax=Galerina marginata (strain CBS 339.88) TaxID=685588 RepID=A0A067S5H1_GALM3|nr:hypothetical protein GALMADRAFT_232746 [Galerina marginata CBS 339.88]
MSTIRNGRISTTSKYAKVIGVPELSLESLEREYSDDDLHSVASVSSSASTRAAEERRKISRAEGCFITKQPGYHLVRAHWVKTVQKDARLKFEVKTFLEGLGIVRQNFSLDAPPNLTPLDRNLHYALDKLGFFAVTCSKPTLQALIYLVEKENAEWQKRGGQYNRYFRFDQPLFTDAMYELVLLHPHHLLPKRGSALTVFTEHGENLSGKMYFVAPDGALRETSENDSPRLPAFPSNRTRVLEHALNPFLVLLNAEIAFRRFKRRSHPLCADYTELIDLTIDLVDKIYFKPIVDQIERRRNQDRLVYSTHKDVHIDKAVTKESAKNSRMGIVVEQPGPDASHEEIVEYHQYLMSGCDYTDEDSEDSDHDDGFDDDYN